MNTAFVLRNIKIILCLTPYTLDWFCLNVDVETLYSNIVLFVVAGDKIQEWIQILQMICLATKRNMKRPVVGHIRSCPRRRGWLAGALRHGRLWRWRVECEIWHQLSGIWLTWRHSTSTIIACSGCHPIFPAWPHYAPSICPTTSYVVCPRKSATSSNSGS